MDPSESRVSHQLFRVDGSVPDITVLCQRAEQYHCTGTDGQSDSNRSHKQDSRTNLVSTMSLGIRDLGMVSSLQQQSTYLGRTVSMHIKNPFTMWWQQLLPPIFQSLNNLLGLFSMTCLPARPTHSYYSIVAGSQNQQSKLYTHCQCHGLKNSYNFFHHST